MLLVPIPALPGLKTTICRCWLGDRFQRDAVAQPLQTMHEAMFHRLPIPRIEVIGPEVVITVPSVSRW